MQIDGQTLYRIIIFGGYAFNNETRTKNDNRDSSGNMGERQSNGLGVFNIDQT